MANRALGAPRLTGPQPVSGQAVTTEAGDHVESLITAGDSRRADAIFFYAMVACGLSVLAIVFLIVYELVTKSNLSWHAFGLKFFFRIEWEPVNARYRAMPFVFLSAGSSHLV